MDTLKLGRKIDRAARPGGSLIQATRAYGKALIGAVHGVGIGGERLAAEAGAPGLVLPPGGAEARCGNRGRAGGADRDAARQFFRLGGPRGAFRDSIGDARQFFAGNTVLAQLPNGVFGETLMPNPPRGGPAGQAEGMLGFVDVLPTGPVPQLGAFIDPFTLLSGHGIDPAAVSAFSEALQFAPQALIPPTGAPEPEAAAILGIGVLGLLTVRNRRRPGATMAAAAGQGGWS
jgi:hypothetical protein